MRNNAPSVGSLDSFVDRRHLPCLDGHEIFDSLLDQPRFRTASACAIAMTCSFSAG